MTGPSEEKRRQHHVWQHYLRSWCVEGQLYCLREGRIFPSGTSAVAVESYFYKLLDFQPGDVELIHFLLLEDAKLTKQLHETFLARLIAPMQMSERIKKRVRDKRVLAAIDAALKVYQTNVIEDYHMGVENIFVSLLERIKVGDISFYPDGDECIPFFKFICTQQMRTKGVKEKTIENSRGSRASISAGYGMS